MLVPATFTGRTSRRMAKKRRIAMAIVSITSPLAPARMFRLGRAGAGVVSVAVARSDSPCGGVAKVRTSPLEPNYLVNDGLGVLRRARLFVIVLDGVFEVPDGLADRAAEAAQFAGAEDDQDDHEDDDEMPRLQDAHASLPFMRRRSLAGLHAHRCVPDRPGRAPGGS